MRSFEYLADGNHVDDAGNLISCTYVDFRDPAERFSITTLKKASSKLNAIPGCETIRISKPSCFRGQGEGVVVGGEDGPAASATGKTEPAGHPRDPSGPRALAEPPSTPKPGAEALFGRNGWIYCASIEPETPEERAAWREAMPTGYEAVSPIRRPRAFARALGAMVAEQAGPRGAIVLLRNTVEGHAFCTAHKSQPVYHGPVVYADEPYRRLERASSDLELMLLLVFLKDAAQRDQREYRFFVWAEDEPSEDRVGLEVSPALVDAVWKPRKEPEGSGFVPAGADESLSVERMDYGGSSRAGGRVEALPALLGATNPTVAPWGDAVETVPRHLPETTVAPAAAVAALRAAVERVATGSRRDAAAAAWHAEPVVRFFCSTFGEGIAGVRVSEEGFIVVAAELAGNGLVEASIAVGPDGTCACRVSAGGAHMACTAADGRSFERVLKERLAEAGVRRRDRDS